MDVFIGIDVACAKGKYLPIVMCSQENGRLVPLPLGQYPIKPPRGLGNALTLHDEVNSAFANDVANYIETVCESFHLNPIRIGIDSPLRPRNDSLSRRFAEQALDKAGISCYTTPSTADFEAIKAKGIAHLQSDKPIQNLPHAHQIFMLLGFALNKRLSKIAFLSVAKTDAFLFRQACYPCSTVCVHFIMHGAKAHIACLRPIIVSFRPTSMMGNSKQL